MLKTNSKIVRERIKNYIITHFEPDHDLIGTDDEPKTFHEIANYIWNDFIKRQAEYDLYYRNRQELFSEWCSGLPGTIDTAPYWDTGSAVKLLGDILEETESERETFSEWDAERMMDFLIYREIIREVRK